MMANKEIAIINRLIEEHKPRHCLEWGSGNSTIYFPSVHKKIIKSWIAIEHSGHYIQDIRSLLPDNANIIWVPESEWYVDSVKHSRIFDFILIDGLHRERCLEIAKDIISDDGIILLHDSGRAEYQDFIKKYNGTILIDGEEPYQGHYKHRGLAKFTK